ncbi:MAG: hypothetical protein QOD74_2222 [Variibacter sp.]|nr:hypothetical protein [Variibacter sp.]
MVLEGLRGEDSIAELCRREGIAQNLYKHTPFLLVTLCAEHSSRREPRVDWAVRVARS